MSTVPTFVAAGTYTSGTGALTVPMPAGIQAGDLLVLFAESENQDIATPTTGGTWTQISTAQGTGTAANATSARLEIWYRFATASETSVTVADSGDHTSARILAFRGVEPSNPFTGTAAGGVVAAASTAISVAGITTDANNALVVYAVASSIDLSSTSQAASWANASLTSVTERSDNTTTSGDGGGLHIATGILATAGATGTMTATLTTSTVQAYMCFALRAQVNFSLTAAAGTFTFTGQAAALAADPILLDRFEKTTRFDHLIPLVRTSDASVDRRSASTSNVTQGTYSTRYNGTVTPGTGNVLFSSNADPNFRKDFTAYKTLKLDVHVATMAASRFISLTVFDEASPDSETDSTPASSTGTYTLEVDLLALTDRTDCYVQILLDDASASPNIDVYFDNLRLVDMSDVEHLAFDFEDALYDGLGGVLTNLSNGWFLGDGTETYLSVNRSSSYETEGSYTWKFDYDLGSSYVFEDLIEGFESFSGSLPNTLTWDNDVLGVGPIGSTSQVTSGVTQGTYGMRMNGSLSAGGTQYAAIGLRDFGAGASGIDLTGITALSVDITVTDATNCSPFIIVNGADGSYYWNISPKKDGTFTLHVSQKFQVLSAGTVTFGANCNIVIGVGPDNSSAGTFDVTFDNLRTYSGSGPNISNNAFLIPENTPILDYLRADIYVETLPTNGKLVFGAPDGTGNGITYLGEITATGQQELIIDFTGSGASLFQNAPNLVLWFDDPGSADYSGDAVFYIDNMRMTDDPGVVDYPLSAAVGTFTLSGQNANFLRSLKLGAALGTFTFSGIAAGLNSGRLITADPATFSLTGQTANLNKGNTLTADAATFTLTGQDALFQWTHILGASSGTFTLSGQDNILKRALKLTSDVGTFVMTGVDAALSRIRVIQSDVGTFNLTGIAAGLSAVRTMTAAQGSFILTGQDATLMPVRKLAADRGIFSLNGSGVGVSIPAPIKEFDFVSYDPTFVGERTVTKIATPAKAFVITPYAPRLDIGVNIQAPLTAFTLTSGPGVYKVQNIETCSGETIPLSHMEDSRKLQADAYIDLFEIVLSNKTTKVYLKMNKTVDWQGNTYEGTGIKIEGVGSYADDQVSRPKLTIWNPEGIFSALTDAGALDNAVVIRTRILKEHMDEDLPIYRKQRWRVTRVAGLNRKYIALELRDMLDGQNFLTPGRMFIPPDFPSVSLS